MGWLALGEGVTEKEDEGIYLVKVCGRWIRDISDGTKDGGDDE
jgi:hypothetical protein